VAVARAVIRQPDLLIADEPTGSQDRDNTWGLMELFVRENRRGCAVVLATHDLDIVRKVKKPCAVLRDGKLVFEENPWSC
jgi:cell division transport system ATP-binding protein